MATFSAETAPAGKEGGQTTVQRTGAAPMAAIGKKGFAATVAKHWHGDRARYLAFLQSKELAATDRSPPMARGNARYSHPTSRKQLEEVSMEAD